MKWWLLAVLGVTLNGAGLCLFGDAVMHHMLQPDALNAWFWTGTFSLVCINAGICCLIEAAKWSPRP